MIDYLKYDDAEIVMGDGTVRIPVIIAQVESSGGGMFGPRSVIIECHQTGKSTHQTKENDMARLGETSMTVSVDPAGSYSPDKHDRPEVRKAVAEIISDALHDSREVEDVLVLDEEGDNSGPMGGTSSSILAYITLVDGNEPVAVAINVYADDKIAAKAEDRLDELEKRTALSDRLARVRALLEGDS